MAFDPATIKLANGVRRYAVRSHRLHGGRIISASPDLSVDLIVTAATALIDEAGLERFSVRELARRLDVFPTAIYWHVGSRSRLLSLAAGRLVAQVGISVDADAIWQDALVDIAHRIREAMHRHPNFSSMFGAQIGIDLAPSLPLAEAILRQLVAGGCADDQIVPVYNTYTGTVLGWVSIELSKPAASKRKDGDWEQTVAADLASLDPEQYPNTQRLAIDLADRAFMTRRTSGIERPLNRSFETMLRVLIAGIEHEISESS